jgi:hypothetical protein
MSCNNDVSISYLVCLRLTHEIVCCWLLPIYICEYVIYISVCICCQKILIAHVGVTIQWQVLGRQVW